VALGLRETDPEPTTFVVSVKFCGVPPVDGASEAS
jgi:hypothetical protein